MIDVGLMVTIALVLTVPSVFVKPWPPGTLPSGVFDASLGGLAVGLVVGRTVALALDDPSSLTRLSDLLVIRSGVEFWPGVAAGVGWIALQARREHVHGADRLATLAPAALVGWALYEASCVIRDGCPGPVMAVGLRPDGHASRMFPVGLVVAVAAAAGAFLIDRLRRRGLRGVEAVVFTAGLVAGVRSVASVWLPHIGTGLTRQHRESIVVTVGAALTFAALRIGARRGRVEVGAA